VRDLTSSSGDPSTVAQDVIRRSGEVEEKAALNHQFSAIS